MKEIKLSFPYPSTSRHNLSQDVGTSLSMGLVIPVRTVEVLAGDSHRVGTSFSLISNPLVKPLLQGVNMRYCRFWVPRRIYHLDQRANNSGYDPMDTPVRHGVSYDMYFPVIKAGADDPTPVQLSNYGQSSLFDYLRLSPLGSNFISPDTPGAFKTVPTSITGASGDLTYYLMNFNAEPYVAYIDICRNYFADSANNMIAWSWFTGQSGVNANCELCVAPLNQVDGYIDSIQNGRGRIKPYNVQSSYVTTSTEAEFNPFLLPRTPFYNAANPLSINADAFSKEFSAPHFGLCVPLNRPDRLSRLFDTRPLTSQNATIAPSEISIANLSFLAKIQRFFTRRFFGGSRFTDVMYSVYGQKVPHVDSPVLLDVFDYEIGSELVASTNASETQNPGVLGGFFSAAGQLTPSRGGFKRRYRFNEPGYLIDLVYIMPRIFRTAFVPDYYFISSGAGAGADTPMLQGNFVSDFNGIGWQQPAQTAGYLQVGFPSGGSISAFRLSGFSCEPSWQQYRTLPDVCSGAMNPLNYPQGAEIFRGIGKLTGTTTLNSPLFTFNDRMIPYNVQYGFSATESVPNPPIFQKVLLARNMYTDFNTLNSVFGTDTLGVDNIFCIFRYAHQAKRQVTKRFTLTFN